MGMAAILVMWPGPFEQTNVPQSHKAPCEIWLWLAQWLLRRRCLKTVDDDGRRRRRTTEAYLSYKLTKWAFGSSELISDGARSAWIMYIIICWSSMKRWKVKAQLSVDDA